MRFRDRVYVLNCSDLKNPILMEFHVKPYLGHLGYPKISTMVKNFYYQQNLKRKVAKFVAICLDSQ